MRALPSGVQIMKSQPIPRPDSDDGLKRGRSKAESGAADREQLLDLLDERLRFESMLARLSATFINLQAPEVDSQIERGLQLLVETLDIDRSSLAQFSEDGQELLATHSYTTPDFSPFPKINIAPLWPWYTEQIRQGRLLRFTRLPEELPAEAVHEREYYRRGNSVQSHLAIPFKVGRSVLGGLGFGSFRKRYDWPDELIQSLRLVGEIFANALARKRAEEKETRLRDQAARASRISLMGELAASIAHEVNQPLCAIVGNAQTAQSMLARGTFDVAEVREILEDIARDGQRASAVIARIRQLLQKAPGQRRALEVNELIREAVLLTKGEMTRRRVAVKLELTEQLPSVLGDRVQLQQVILNLMTNGADAMDRVEGERRELEIRSTQEQNGNVLVSVTDCGSGVDPHNRERLFDSFFTTQPGGMGMGLAICKSITEAHGGRIWASPNAGRGSTFQFTLPGIREDVL